MCIGIYLIYFCKVKFSGINSDLENSLKCPLGRANRVFKKVLGKMSYTYKCWDTSWNGHSLIIYYPFTFDVTVFRVSGVTVPKQTDVFSLKISLTQLTTLFQFDRPPLPAALVNCLCTLVFTLNSRLENDNWWKKERKIFKWPKVWQKQKLLVFYSRDSRSDYTAS
jgi:hypothetical protein